MAEHVSVLLNEAIGWLDPGPGKVIVDGTLGGGGHAAAILEKVTPGGRLIGLDKDPAAVREAARRFGGRDAVVLQKDFADIRDVLLSLGLEAVDGVLLDLGVSSLQLEDAGRGLSFLREGPLDMRLDPASALTAEEIVNQFPAEKIRQILWTLGEERMARRIADRIVEARRARVIRTTRELEAIVFHAAPRAYRHGRIHPATRTFQALRIAVNGELESLGRFLKEAPDFLKPGGRLAVISFHSLEDRLVKNRLREWEKERMGTVLTKKPVVPAEAEERANPRSRSAKLRAFQRREEGGR